VDPPGNVKRPRPAAQARSLDASRSHLMLDRGRSTSSPMEEAGTLPFSDRRTSGTSPSREEAPGEWMSVDEFAAWAGLDRKTVYEAVRRNAVPGVLRLTPRRIRISRTVLLASLSGQPGGSLKGNGT